MQKVKRGHIPKTMIKYIPFSTTVMTRDSQRDNRAAIWKSTGSGDGGVNGAMAV
jgi:hypothetical protein